MRITSIKLVFLFLASVKAVSLYVKDEDTGMYRQQEVSRVSGSQTGENGLTSAQAASFAQRAAESIQAMDRLSYLPQANPNSRRISHVSSSLVSESEPIRETANDGSVGCGGSLLQYDRMSEIEESQQHIDQRIQERAARMDADSAPPENLTIMQRIKNGCYKVYKIIHRVCVNIFCMAGILIFATLVACGMIIQAIYCRISDLFEY